MRSLPVTLILTLAVTLAAACEPVPISDGVGPDPDPKPLGNVLPPPASPPSEMGMLDTYVIVPGGPIQCCAPRWGSAYGVGATVTAFTPAGGEVTWQLSLAGTGVPGVTWSRLINRIRVRAWGSGGQVLDARPHRCAEELPCELEQGDLWKLDRAPDGRDVLRVAVESHSYPDTGRTDVDTLEVILPKGDDLLVQVEWDSDQPRDVSLGDAPMVYSYSAQSGGTVAAKRAAAVRYYDYVTRKP